MADTRTKAEARREREQLRREIAAELRRKDRAKLNDLRAAIKEARGRKRHAMARTVDQCRAARCRVRKWYRERRAELLAKLRGELAHAKLAARAACDATKADVRATGIRDTEAARRVLEAERAYQSEIRGADVDAKRRARAFLAKAHERRAESDDEVRQNIPDDLRRAFNRVRKHIKGTPKLSRTEAFLKWAEEHPDEIFAMRAADADRDVARLVAEHQEHERKMRKADRYRREPEELARELAAVPF